MADTLAVEQLNRYNDLKGERDSQFLPTWQDLAQYFMPSQSAINTQKLPGTTSGWTDNIYSSDPINAANTLSAGQRNWLTPSAEPWFSYEAPEFLKVEGREQDLDDAEQWLSRATMIVQRELARSNFYGMVNIDYDQVGVFGTGMLFAEEGKKTAFNFRQFKPWFLTIEEDDEGIVDSVHREFELTTRQAVQQFGIDNVGKTIFEAHGKPAELSKRWKFLHACFPRDDSKKFRGRFKAGKDKPIASVYIAIDDKITVQVGGYDEMPYLCSRFKSWGAPTTWGYGPAYLVLAEARQLNFVSQYRDALTELRAYPRMLYPDNLDGDVDLRAGGVTVFDHNNPVLPQEWMTQGDNADAKENMIEKKDTIDRAFYVNMFTMLEQLSDKDMTAYEIAQRLGEKLEQFTPIFDRRVTEFLNPLLNRLFSMSLRQGILGEPPQSLMVPVDGGREVSLALPVVAITSRISQALKALGNTAIINTMAVIQPIAALVPDILDNFKWDNVGRTVGRNYGMDPALLAGLDEMAQIRQQRAEQAAQQRAAELANSLTSSAKDLGGAPKEITDAVVSRFTGDNVPVGA